MDEKLVLKDGNIWIMEDIKKTLQQVYDHYRSVCNRNDYLKKEIEKVKSEKYTDEELSRLKSAYDKMKSDYYRGFPISEEEDKNIKEWIKNQQKKILVLEVLLEEGLHISSLLPGWAHLVQL